MGFQREVLIEAGIERVWKAWTDSAEAAQWLAPRAKVDFRPGGAFEFFWSDDPRRDSTLGCVILEIEPERSLRFEWQGRTDFLHMFLLPEGSRTVIEVSFQHKGRNTLVTLDHPETRDHPDWGAYEVWMSKAWEAALEALKAHCERAAADAAPERP